MAIFTKNDPEIHPKHSRGTYPSDLFATTLCLPPKKCQIQWFGLFMSQKKLCFIFPIFLGKYRCL